MMPTGESRDRFKRRLLAEGIWSKFVLLRENLKAQGTAPGEAWREAARQVGEPATDGDDRPSPVDLWIVVGPADAERTKALVTACQDRMPVVVTGYSTAPSLLTGFEYIGVLPARPADQGDAERLAEHLHQVTDARVEVFGAFESDSQTEIGHPS